MARSSTVLDLPRRPVRASSPSGGRRGEVAAPAARRSRDRYGDLVRERYPDIPRRVSGYNLDDLLPENGLPRRAGARRHRRARCVTVLEATVHLIDSPPCRTLLVAGLRGRRRRRPTTFRTCWSTPLGLEGVDERADRGHDAAGQAPARPLAAARRRAAGSLVEFGGETKDEADDAGARAASHASSSAAAGCAAMKLLRRPAERAARLGGPRGRASARPRSFPGQPDTLRGLGGLRRPAGAARRVPARPARLADRYGYRSALYGHFGQGCVHARIELRPAHAPTASPRSGASSTRPPTSCSRSAARSRASTATASRVPSCCRRCSATSWSSAFREFKSIWDPDWKMNPGKVVDAVPDHVEPAARHRLPPAGRPDALRVSRRRRQLRARDARAASGSATAARRRAGSMCPSYMVDPRGEALDARPRPPAVGDDATASCLHSGARADVLDALDLCLSCKGCTNDCPVNVDMPTLKAEYLSHHYAGRLRPRQAYAFGLIDRWARIGSLAPRAGEPVHPGARCSPPSPKLQPASHRNAGCRRSRR